MNIALIAHDAKKKLMQNFCIAYRGILSKNELFATGTTGRLIEEVTNLKNQNELVFWSEHKSTAWYCKGELNDLCCRFPEKNETGIFVWFKRSNWLRGKDFEQKIETRNKELLLETKEAIIYRIKNENN